MKLYSLSYTWTNALAYFATTKDNNKMDKHSSLFCYNKRHKETSYITHKPAIVNLQKLFLSLIMRSSKLEYLSLAEFSSLVLYLRVRPEPTLFEYLSGVLL